MSKKVSLQFREEKKSETIVNTGLSRVNLVSLDAGEAVDTHRAKVPATAIVIEGEIALSTGSGEVNLKPGEVLLLDANEPHSLKALQKSTVVVTRLGADAPKESDQSSKPSDQVPECNH